MNTTSASGVHPHFTVSQWQELEHQALIFKYMMAGVPVPPDLLVPIRRSIESPALFNHPSMGYYSFYGKKPDPEPGRCRRTDGKKWRCSKDAHPDSKYCERHMHRGRNRSRKPVESHTISHPPLSVNSLAPTSCGSGTSPNNFQNIPFGSPMTDSQGSNTSQLQMDPSPYGMGNKDYRYLQGIRGEVDGHSFFSEASGIDRGIGMHSSLDSSGRLLPSRVCVQPSKQINDAVRQSNYSQVHDLQNLGSISVTSAVPKQQQQHYLFGSEFGPPAPVKQEGQSLRPFFDEWPKSRNSWSNLEDERSNPISFSTTQLSMSIPMASSDFSAASSRSTNDEG